MKINYLFLFFLPILLGATCSKRELEHANRLFAQATHESNLKSQIKYLKDSLMYCFTYEVQYSLLILEVSTKLTREERIEHYNQALEVLSLIENQDTHVLQEQKRINQTLAQLYQESNDSLSANIYQRKAQQQVNDREKRHYYGWFYAFFLLLFGWGIYDLFRRG